MCIAAESKCCCCSGAHAAVAAHSHEGLSVASLLCAASAGTRCIASLHSGQQTKPRLCALQTLATLHFRADAPAALLKRIKALAVRLEGCMKDRAISKDLAVFSKQVWCCHTMVLLHDDARDQSRHSSCKGMHDAAANNCSCHDVYLFIACFSRANSVQLPAQPRCHHRAR